LARLLRGLQSVELALAVAALLAAALALIADLVGRELLGQGVFGAQRAAVHLTFVAGVLGFSVAVGTGAHLRIKAAEAVVPRRWDPAVERAASVVSMLLLLGLAWYAARFTLQTAQVGERSPTLQIPIWPIQAVMVWAFLSGAARYAIYLADPSLKPKGEPS